MAHQSHATVLAADLASRIRPPPWGPGILPEMGTREALSSIQSGVAREIGPLSRNLGVDSEPVIRAAGLDPATLTDPNMIIPLRAFCALIARSGACTGCPHFGLLLGQRVRVSSLGFIGSLMMHSETVGGALRGLIRHVDLHCVGATTTLTASGATAVWSCVVYEPRTECADQIADAAAAAGLNVLRALCGEAWSPDEVLLPRAVPEDEPTYRRVFHAPVRFNREAASLVFPAQHLDRSIPGADPLVLAVLREGLAEQGRKATPDFTARLRQLLRTELMHGGCTAGRVAGLLSLHRRTLARRLHAEGTAFRAVANEGRFEIARQLIDYTDIPFGQIAAALGFSEAAAFTRAFRRWSGHSPTAWRASHR